MPSTHSDRRSRRRRIAKGLAGVAAATLALAAAPVTASAADHGGFDVSYQPTGPQKVKLTTPGGDQWLARELVCADGPDGPRGRMKNLTLNGQTVDIDKQEMIDTGWGSVMIQNHGDNAKVWARGGRAEFVVGFTCEGSGIPDLKRRMEFHDKWELTVGAVETRTVDVCPDRSFMANIESPEAKFPVIVKKDQRVWGVGVTPTATPITAPKGRVTVPITVTCIPERY
jgi:hypothetical protein